MATNYKITYKNHCTPQEYLTENTRWYLDSDIGAKLTGTAVMDLSTTQPTYITGSINPGAVASHATSGYVFYYVKNISDPDLAGGILISMREEYNPTGTPDDYRIFLGPGECFASKVSTFAALRLTSAIETHTYECIRGT